MRPLELAVPYKIEDVGLTRQLNLSPLLKSYFKLVGEIFSFQNIFILTLTKKSDYLCTSA